MTDYEKLEAIYALLQGYLDDEDMASWVVLAEILSFFKFKEQTK